MNSTNQKFNWTRLASILGILFTAIALIGIGIILRNWSDLYHLNINGSRLNFILPIVTAAWIVDLICGILLFKRRKALGRILIVILVFLFMSFLPAQS
jgi:hypothetical protein